MNVNRVPKFVAPLTSQSLVPLVSHPFPGHRLVSYFGLISTPMPSPLLFKYVASLFSGRW
jgi:hypothetical protein